MCIRCGEHEVPPGRSFCVHCAFAVRAEVEEGFRQIYEYLDAWAKFDRWCASHGRAAPA